MTRKQLRLTMIAAAGSVLVLAAVLILTALSEQIVYFHSPSDLAEKEVSPGERIRLGGLVSEGSFHKGEGFTARFAITDTNLTTPVYYDGSEPLPDLFREGQGVIAEGQLDPGGNFRSDKVLAKHDENYMPREVADALKAQGVWQHGGEGGEGVGRPADQTEASQ